MTTTTAPRARDLTEPVSPSALRLRRPGWRDPRLLLGLVLVAVSVALGSLLVSAAARTSPVLVAAGPLVPGDVLDADAVQVRHVRLGGDEQLYLAPDHDLDGAVVVRTVGDGELVPRAALVPEADLGLRPVAITPSGPVASELAAGETVDLWFVPAAPTGSDDGVEPPRELAAGLTVAEVSEQARFAVGGGTTVHVLVDVETLPEVLGALAADGSVEVVHVPGGGRP
jgi:hypothetical protein